jgi:hypothetical protein
MPIVKKYIGSISQACLYVGITTSAPNEESCVPCLEIIVMTPHDQVVYSAEYTLYILTVMYPELADKPDLLNEFIRSPDYLQPSNVGRSYTAVFSLWNHSGKTSIELPLRPKRTPAVDRLAQEKIDALEREVSELKERLTKYEPQAE